MGLSEDLDVGSLGFFWPIEAATNLDLDSDPLRGHLRKVGHWAVLEALEEDVEAAWLRYNPASHDAVAGVLVDHSVMLLEVQSGGHIHNFGGFKASVQRHEARTVLNHIPLDRLRSEKLTAMQARFLGISHWAGMSAVTEKFEHDQHGRGKAWSVRVESTSSASARLRGGGILTIEPHWRTEGRAEYRTVTAPIAISCRFPTPRPVWDLLKPLAQVQDLLSFLHGGFVAAQSGTASLHLRRKVPDLRTLPELWNGLLMVCPPSAPALPKNPIVLMTLQELGGMRGLARWVHLANTHPRAVQPFLRMYRHGPTTAELGLMEAAAGIEYWVNVHKSSAKWARFKGSHTKRLASNLGRDFKSWIADPDGWAELFRTTNNKLKHDPNAALDPHLVADLAHSGRLALAAAVLNEAALTKTPGRSVFAGLRFQDIGERLRSALT